MSFSGAITAVKAAITGADASLNETPAPLRNGLGVAPRARFDSSYYLGIESDGRPDEHGIQPAGQERSRCRLVLQIGVTLQNDRNDDQSELQELSQKVVNALTMLQDSNIVYLFNDERPTVFQEDRRIVWSHVWNLVYRI